MSEQQEDSGEFVMLTCTSSLISSFGYSLQRRVLRVVFATDKSTWDYANVPPETFEAMHSASSVGKFFYANVRKAFPAIRIS